LVLLFILPGCSVSRNRIRSGTEIPGQMPEGSVLDIIKNQNITANGFFIQKAEIEITTEEGKEKFFANIKFTKPDKYLISLRNRTGIEGARIYLSGDTILVNDRVNKKLYSGSSIYAMKKYGISQSFLPLIFGDIILEKHCESGQEKCKDGKMDLSCLIKGIRLEYSIDCSKKKILFVDQMNNFGQNVNIKYQNFFNVEGKLIPRNIEYSDNQRNTTIKIKVVKVQLPWEGVINFIPGKGYELIELV
jgi:hypothetical protein